MKAPLAIRFLTLALGACVLARAAASATEDNGKIGYWWYQKPVDPPAAPSLVAAPDKPVHPDLPPPPAEAELMKIYPTDVEKMITDYRQYALWKMTPEHVSWYYRLQDFARRRAQAFTNETEVVMLENSDLNMQTAYPENVPGQDARKAQQLSQQNQVIASVADKAALILLVKDSCDYCKAEETSLKYFASQHSGFEVRTANIDQHPELKEKFAVGYTPTTVVIFRGTDQWMPVAVGVESVPNIEANVYRAVRMVQGDTTAETFTMQENERGGVLDPAAHRAEGAP